MNTFLRRSFIVWMGAVLAVLGQDGNFERYEKILPPDIMQLSEVPNSVIETLEDPFVQKDQLAEAIEVRTDEEPTTEQVPRQDALEAARQAQREAREALRSKLQDLIDRNCGGMVHGTETVLLLGRGIYRLGDRLEIRRGLNSAESVLPGFSLVWTDLTPESLTISVRPMTDADETEESEFAAAFRGGSEEIAAVVSIPRPLRQREVISGDN